MCDIYCNHPVVIRNPKLRLYLIRYRAYVCKGRIYVLTDRELDMLKYSDKALGNYGPFRLGVTKDNLDQFYVIDLRTGFAVDMFLLVPCGKCILCRDKKAREWAFRAACENWASKSVPLFVTLTYDNEHLPAFGLCKRDIQLFLKRLRINLTRLLGYPCVDLRYFVCGEYGTNTHRAHYHVIFWNFPVDFHFFPNLVDKLHFVEKAWKKGFCMCLPIIKGGVQYVMKYMRKECYVPFGCTPTFFLSSRRHGGIGAAYANYMRTWFMDNPDAVEFKVFDPYQNVELTSTLPRYFKNLIFPCNSKLIPKEIRDAFTEFQRRLNNRNAFMRKYDVDRYNLSLEERDVLKRFSFLGVTITDKDFSLYDPDLPLSFCSFDEYTNNELRILELVDVLSSYKMDLSNICEIIEKKQRHYDSVSLFYKDSSNRDINYIAENLQRKLDFSRYKEKL